ncbi:unnamed protein product [Lymnaea stagnalis]|uniref:Uncharacterized protein n=1 Tax=Lymnaea stagnalis TaxID=6523 RepID=A0AAV2HYW4_LYMST
MPFLSENRGCFCCEPSVSYPQQFQGLGAVTRTLGSTLQQSTGHFNQDCPLGPLLQDIHLNDSYSNQQQFYAFENQNSQNSTHKTEATVNQDINMFIPSYDCKNFDSVSSSVSFRGLQNREIGGRLSSSAPVTSLGCKMSVSLGEDPMLNANYSDSMDLDSALDELGMLSTITNSRRQFLIESRGQASLRKREHRLRSKSESSPNLASLGRPNGYHIVQLDTNFVTNVSDLLPVSDQMSSPMINISPQKSEHTRLEYRNPDVLEESVRRRRSVPRMSRMRKDRYRRSRCPYKIPNRLCNSMQESDFGSEFFENCASPFLSSNSTPETIADTLTNRLTEAQLLSQSKSTTASPVKPCHDLRLVRSLSAEDLTPIRRRLEQELNEQARESSKTEQSLDLMTSQMTNLHMV